MMTAAATDAPIEIIDPAPPRPLLRAVAHARRLALHALEAPAQPPTCENWQAIAETQATLATRALEALAELVAALGPAPTR